MNRALVSPKPADSLAQEGQVLCPRCQEPLIDPKGLGWCRACGYCQSLAETEKKVVVSSEPARLNQLTATTAAAGSIPLWFWVAFLGSAIIAGATFYGGHYLVLSPLHRALLTLTAIGTGLVIMFIGQFIGLLRIAPDVATLTFKDAVIPMRLYGLIFKRLPGTQLTVYCGSWGLILIITSVIFIGGLTHLFSLLPSSNQKNKANPVQKVKSAR